MVSGWYVLFDVLLVCVILLGLGGGVWDVCVDEEGL